MIYGIAVDGDELWYIDSHTGLLIELNIREGTFMGSYALFPNGMKSQTFSEGIVCGNRIIFAPVNSEYIIIFHKDTKNVETIKIQKDSVSCGHSVIMHFNDLIGIKDKLYFIPRQYDAMIEFDLLNNQLSYHREFVKHFPTKVEKKQRMELCYRGAVWQDKIFLFPSVISNRVVWYNVESQDNGYFDGQMEGKNFVDLCVDGDTLYLLPRNRGEIYLYDLRTMSYIKKIEFQKEEMGEDLFLIMIDCGEYLLIPKRFTTKHSYVIDKKSLRVDTIDIFEGMERYEKSIFYAYRANEDEVWLVLKEDHADVIGIFNISSRKTTWKCFWQMRWHSCLPNDIKEENAIINLEDYMNYLRGVWKNE